jgi:hypothetical protein
MAIECLLFSDQPVGAFELISREIIQPSRSKETDLVSLIRLSRWVDSKDVGTYIRVFLTHDSELVRAEAFLTLIECAGQGGLFEDIRDLALLFVAAEEMSASEADWSVPGRIAELLKPHPVICSTLIADSASAGDLREARRWLRLLNHLGGDESLNSAIAIAERWGEENVNVVSSLAPYFQERGRLQFNGFFANWRKDLYSNRNFRSRLTLMASSADPMISAAAMRSVNWMERERLSRGL